MWDSGGDNEDDGSGDYDNYDDNETSSVQFSFTNVENNRSEESVIELPGIFMIYRRSRLRLDICRASSFRERNSSLNSYTKLSHI